MPATSSPAISTGSAEALRPRPGPSPRPPARSTASARTEAPAAASASRWRDSSSSAAREGGAHVAQNSISTGRPASAEQRMLLALEVPEREVGRGERLVEPGPAVAAGDVGSRGASGAGGRRLRGALRRLERLGADGVAALLDSRLGG